MSKISVKGQRKVPVYIDGEYFEQMEYAEPIERSDFPQLLDDAFEMIANIYISGMNYRGHIGADMFGNIAVFIKEGVDE